MPRPLPSYQSPVHDIVLLLHAVQVLSANGSRFRAPDFGLYSILLRSEIDTYVSVMYEIIMWIGKEREKIFQIQTRNVC